MSPSKLAHVSFRSQGLSFFIYTLYGCIQTHTGLEDSEYTVKLLHHFVKGLVRRREGKNTEMRKIYVAPSLEWARGDKAAPRARVTYPGIGNWNKLSPPSL